MEETVAAQPVVIKIENRVVKNLALLILSDGRTPLLVESIFIERGQETGYGVRPVILLPDTFIQVIIKRCPLAKRMDNPVTGRNVRGLYRYTRKSICSSLTYIILRLAVQHPDPHGSGIRQIDHTVQVTGDMVVQKLVFRICVLYITRHGLIGRNPHRKGLVRGQQGIKPLAPDDFAESRILRTAFQYLHERTGLRRTVYPVMVVPQMVLATGSKSQYTQTER